MKERIDQLMASLGLNLTEFSAITTIPPASLCKMGEGLSAKNLKKLGAKYENLNFRWLIMGEGEMWLKEPVSEPSKDKGHNLSRTPYTAEENEEIAFLRALVKEQQMIIKTLAAKGAGISQSVQR